MNLIDKIREEQKVNASQKAIKQAEHKAKSKEILEQINDISNIDFAEWFMTEINLGSDSFPRFAYGELVEKKKTDLITDRLHIVKKKQQDTKIASLIYGSNWRDGFVEANKNYTGDEFRYCLGVKSVDKIMVGLAEMGMTISTEMREPMACNQSPYEVTVLTMK